MDAVNISTAENLEGRIDVSSALGSKDLLMFIYDMDPVRAPPRITTNTTRSGCSSSRARSPCGLLTGSRR